MLRAVFFCSVSIVALAAEPALSKQEQDAALSAIGEYARNYVAKLPNYTATQTTRRKIKPVGMQGLATIAEGTTTLEDQISYVDHREMHKTVAINGKKLAEFDQKDASFSKGEFGGLISTLFLPETRGKFGFERVTSLNGRKVYVFRFEIPQLPYGYGLMEGNHTFMVPFRGTVAADVETKAVVRITVSCHDIPQISSFRTMDLTLNFKPTKVGGEEFMLPANYEIHSQKVDAKLDIESTYRDYQKFSADSTIIFDSEP